MEGFRRAEKAICSQSLGMAMKRLRPEHPGGGTQRKRAYGWQYRLQDCPD